MCVAITREVTTKTTCTTAVCVANNELLYGLQRLNCMLAIRELPPSHSIDPVFEHTLYRLVSFLAIQISTLGGQQSVTIFDFVDVSIWPTGSCLDLL